MREDRDAIVARAGALAREHFATGANCAESVLYAVPLALGDDALVLPSALGTGWTAGVGGSGCMCGALAASVMLAGAQTGDAPGAPAARRALSVDAAGRLHEAFKDEFGSTCCRVLRRGMEPASPECRKHCAEISGRTAEIAAGMLMDRREATVPLSRRIAGRDLANAALPSLGLAAVAAAGFAAALLATGSTVSPGGALAFAVAAVLGSMGWTLWRMSRRGGRR